MDLVDYFFGGIIPATLDEPTHANIEFHDQSKRLSAIIVPRIDSEDELLVFDFYDAGETLEGYNDRRIGVPAHAAVKFDGGVSISAIATQLTTATGGAIGEAVKHSGRLSVVQREVTLTNGPIAFAEFCIEDFPLFWGDTAFEKTEASDSVSTFHSSFRILGRAVFESDGWVFAITECSDRNELGITHSGTVRRVDNRPFSAEQLGHVIDGLTYFLSFITGVYRAPAITIAFDVDFRPVMGYTPRFNQSKYQRPNWFNPQSREAIPRLFPGFWRCFNSHQQEIYSVVGNYAESSIIAHAGLPKNALTFSQAALEGLGRWVLGREQRWKEPASDYIKEALDKAGVNHALLDYPSILKLWQDKYKESGDGDDGLTFITRLRNKSTHAKFAQINISDYLHAWNLSQSYVELLLLRLFDYDHEYYDRASKELRVVPFSSIGASHYRVDG